MQKSSKDKYVFLTVVGIIVFSFIGYSFGVYIEKVRYASFLKSFKNIRENSDKYTFINPLIGGVSAPATDVGLYADIQADIVSYLKQEKAKGELYDHSFYFRDMSTGLWFGDKEASSFFPASLFKLPIAIAIYKQVEEVPNFLTSEILYTQEIASANDIKQLNAESNLVVGRSYTVESLTAKMLMDSDNGAKNLLLSVLDKKYLTQLFALTSLVDPTSSQTYEVSSRKYSLFLRVLYGSSYLNEEHSELLLSMLSKSTFKDGLVAGLPQYVPVAHKFGTYEFPESINGKEILTMQLHDCGVIYHTDRPYIICLMTKGRDAASLFKVISHVSKMVYDYQDKND